ncbi:LysR substrate-binding domain-containing protein [Floccifex sp.]|uniref:LysR substrate-binding domain-containing protein n=1 Tax=Floccifex sp. TaxID=2815810 RepID=UPI003EFD2994
MELEKYKVLVKTIDSGSLSQTAAELGYSISGVSRIISSLEKEIGFSLLERTSNGVIATEKCKTLLPSIKKFIEAGNQIEEKAQQALNLPLKICIGVAHLRIYSWLNEILYQYQKEHNQIDVTLSYGTSSTLAKKVENGELHFAIITKREGNFLWHPLWMDEAVAWVPSSSPLSKLENISLSIFEEESCVFPFYNEETDYSRIFQKYHIKPNLQIMTSDEYATYSVVESGLGISVNFRHSSLLPNEKVIVKSLNPVIDLPIGISYQKNLSEEIKLIMNEFKESCEVLKTKF